tara:strand:+ start:642 stop:836 length:195 start_codon:yes stop_codon:yes gene_type:complete
VKVGDLVKNGQGHTGIVTALGGIHYREFTNTVDCPWENPDVHVITASGKKIWSYNALEVVSESR